MDVFGFTFAILIILYLSLHVQLENRRVIRGSLNNHGHYPGYRHTCNGDDCKHNSLDLGFQFWFTCQTFPFVYSATTGAILKSEGLGLGDFFFAGVLAVQTFNKFGKKTAFIAAVAMAVAFGIWEAFLPDIIAGLNPNCWKKHRWVPGNFDDY